MNQKNKQLFERIQTLEKLKRHTYWLITSDRPVKEKMAIWSKDYEKLCLELINFGILGKN